MEEKLFGEFLKERRKEIGIGSRELSRRVGLAETYVSQTERGKIKKPPFEIAYKLCKELKMDSNTVASSLERFGITENDNNDNYFATNDLYNSHYSNEIYFRHWFSNKSLELKFANNTISKNLESFIDSDLSRANIVINNLYKLISQSEETFDFFCFLLSKDYSVLDETEKENISNYISKIFISHGYQKK